MGTITKIRVEPEDILNGDLQPSRETAYQVLSDEICHLIAECECDEKFLGFNFDITRDMDGKLMAFSLIPVDLVGGTPARRIA